MPLLLGISVGFSLMLLFVGIGLGQLLTAYPPLGLLVKVLGVIYLVYLAWLIANTTVTNKRFEHAKPLSFNKGVLFQWINAKAWVVCFSAISVFTTSGELFIFQTITLAVTFLIVGLPCVVAWNVFGALLRKYMNNVFYLRVFNGFMALLLVMSVIPVIEEVLLELTRLT